MNSQDKESKIALFDLDGSLADWDTAMRDELNAIRGPHDAPLGDNLREYEDAHPSNKRRMALIQSRPGWWRSLRRIEHGFEVLRLANEIGFDIHILTKGPRDIASAWAEKLEWCAAQSELRGVPVHITMDKSLVFGRVLYDDYPKYMDSWLEHRHRGLGIMPVTPSNNWFKNDNVVSWTGANLDDVRSALQAAFDRPDREHWNLHRSLSGQNR